MIFHRYEAASPSGQPLNTPIVRAVLSPPFVSVPFVSLSAAHPASPSAAPAPLASVASSLFFMCFPFRPVLCRWRSVSCRRTRSCRVRRRHRVGGRRARRVVTGGCAGGAGPSRAAGEEPAAAGAECGGEPIQQDREHHD